MEKYSLRQCTLTQLDRLFGLRTVFTSAMLSEWLNREIVLSELEVALLRQLQALLIENTDGWNEQELALHFIGPIFSLVHFTEPYRFNLFAERQIHAVIPGLHSDVELFGEPDGLIATGYREPEISLFAFSEYKCQRGSHRRSRWAGIGGDAGGPSARSPPKPLYGCYVVGYDWRFVVLEGKEYAISQDYSAIRDDIFDIFRILKALKQIVMRLTADHPSLAVK